MNEKEASKLRTNISTNLRQAQKDAAKLTEQSDGNDIIALAVLGTLNCLLSAMLDEKLLINWLKLVRDYHDTLVAEEKGAIQ